MNILTEIVNQLTDNDNPITTSLLKVKVLASRLNNIQLLAWVNKELSGYDSNDVLPQYRKYGCLLMGNYINGNIKFSKQVLVTMGLPDLVREAVDEMEFYQSISVLESYVKDENRKSIQISIPPEFLGYITKVYQDMGNHYFSIYSAWKQLDIGSVRNIISEVRNTLVDLILKLEEEYGFEIKMEELIIRKQEVNQTIQNVMNQTIINNGDGSVINTGSDNSINAEIRINKQNFQELRKQLEANNVPTIEIDELESIIAEKPDLEKNLFGPKVNNWIKKMLEKALDGSWQIGIGSAGTILAELLKQFYGM